MNAQTQIISRNKTIYLFPFQIRERESKQHSINFISERERIEDTQQLFFSKGSKKLYDSLKCTNLRQKQK